MPDLDPQTAAQLLAATRYSAVASLAGGIIAASGRPFSIAEALEVADSVHHAMFSTPGNGRFEAWKTDRDNNLAKVWK